MQIDNQIASRRRRSGRANSNHIPDGTISKTRNEIELSGDELNLVVGGWGSYYWAPLPLRLR
jgi:hypothetical protein